FQFGFRPPVQPSDDGPVWFYLKRLIFTDPLLVLLSLLGVPYLVRAVRAGRDEAALISSWVLVAGGSLLVVHYRNLPYLLYSIPPLCMIAAAYSLQHLKSHRTLVVAGLAVVFGIKAASASQPWGLPFGSAQNVSSAGWFRWYAEQHRPNELI